MGAPVRILDLARDLVRLAGHDPDSQAIEYTGLRPGEKLHEQLSYDGERVEATSSDKVLRLAAPPPQATVRDDAMRILRLATGEHERIVRTVLLEYAGRCERAVEVPLQVEAAAEPPALVGVAH
jgi:FlaA1/EpsC-like NDP-sugar epimerase